MNRLARVAELPERCDLAIVGAGPAGLAAAAMAAGFGLDVVLLDENPEPGGQIYRAVGAASAERRALLGRSYTEGLDLLAELSQAKVAYLPGATVWMASADMELGVSANGESRIFLARHVLLATGALERPLPIEGWTLPGVMTAGAAQILLKTSGLVPEGRFALAGSGPLLWLLASQLVAAGATPALVLETTAPGRWRRAAASLPGFLASTYLVKGLPLLYRTARHCRIVKGITELRAEGGSYVEQVAYRQADGRVCREKVDTLLLHQGVVPNVNMAGAAGCELVWDEDQLCWKAATDDWGRSSVEGISIAGDGAGIDGAEAAAVRGRLCTIDIAVRLGRLSQSLRERQAATHRAALARYRRGRRFLDLLYQPAPSFRRATPDTVVCRCEEVTGRQISETLEVSGSVGPNQMKSFLRCGMGPCQGRMCGLTVTEMIATRQGVPPAEIGYYRLRFPVKPVTVAEIASLPHVAADVRAVVRE